MDKSGGRDIFGNSYEEELHLSKAPLVRVLVQVRWPQITLLKVELGKFAEQFALKLAGKFPFVSQHQEMQVTLSPEGVSQSPGATIHRFTSADSGWTVSLGETFLTLETSRYDSRDDFVLRFREVLSALLEVVDVPLWNRIGFRYTNRLHEAEDLKRLTEYFTPAVLGGQLVKLGPDSKLVHSVNEAVYQFSGANLLVRSARMGANTSIDPTLEPVDSDSWLLDLDSFDETRSANFDQDALISRVEDLSQIAYQYFREVSTPTFIERFR